MRDSKYSWHDLINNHYNAPEKILYRTRAIRRKYDNFNNKLKLLNIDINNFIYTKYLKSERKNYKITLNDFPYNLKYDIMHYILWCNPNIGKIKFNNKIWIDKIITSSFPNKEYICWANITKNQSVKGIPHYHVFIKK